MSSAVIPEITETQLGIIKEAAQRQANADGGGVTIWILPDPLKDTPEEFVRHCHSQDDINHLIELGFLADTSGDEDNAETIKGIEQANQRKARAISVTNWGMLMFGHILGPESKKPN